MSNELTIHSAPVIPYSDMEKMAGVIAQSGLFGVKHPVQALALMLVAQAEDLQAARRRPLDAPMATREPEPWADKTDYRIDTVVARFGARWAVLTLLCMAGSFVVGFFTGRAV